MSLQDATTRRADLGLALGAVLRRYVDAAHEVVAGLPGGPRGYQVLSTSELETCSNQATLAAGLGIDRTVMTYLVDDLERAGLVERQPDPADRRARRVVLLPKGREVLADTSHRLEQVEREVLGGLSDEEADTFRALLARVADGVPTDPGLCTEAAPEC
jgi:DNA-binding MarR family transcriptional regulator